MTTQKLITASTVGLLLALGAGGAMAAPDWGKAPGKKITVFYPGVSPIEWITKGSEHGGAKGLKKGESCAVYHDEEAADMGKKMVTGQKIEPKVIKGKAGSIPVTVQAAHDGTNLYLRFSWKQPAGGAEKMDKDNQVKLAVMFEDNKVERANLSGCWETCHQDARTMPEGKDDKKTKYVVGGDVKGGKFYDLIQWTSKGGKHDGYVADKRVMEGGKALVDAKGEKKGDEWVVTFTRKLAGGGEGDIAMAAGKTYNFGFAIHDDHDYKYDPPEIKVKVGTAVKWINLEKRASHSILFTGPGGFGSDRIFPGESWQRVFDRPGSYPYTCGPHPEMKGRIEVSE